MQNLSYIYMDSPVGQLQLVANETALVAVLWDCEKPNWVKLATLVEDPQHPVLNRSSGVSFRNILPVSAMFLSCLWTLLVPNFRKSLAGFAEYSLWTDPKLSGNC